MNYLCDQQVIDAPLSDSSSRLLMDVYANTKDMIITTIQSTIGFPSRWLFGHACLLIRMGKCCTTTYSQEKTGLAASFWLLQALFEGLSDRYIGTAMLLTMQAHVTHCFMSEISPDRSTYLCHMSFNFLLQPFHLTGAHLMFHDSHVA